MKSQQFFSCSTFSCFIAAMAISVFTFVSCSDMEDVGPTPGHNEVSADWNEPTPDPEAAIDVINSIGDTVLTVDEACMKCHEGGNGWTSEKNYYVKGYVQRKDDKYADGVLTYGNGTFYLSSQKERKGDLFTFEAYQVYGYNRLPIDEEDEVQEGDFVILSCKLTNYNGTFETTGQGAGYIYWSTNEKAIQRGAFLDNIEVQEGEYSVTDIVELFKVNRDNKTPYTVRGGVTAVSKIDFLNTGIATFTISDGKTEMVCNEFMNGADQDKFVNSRQVKLGDIVTVVGTRTVLDGKPAMKGYLQSTTNTDEGMVDPIEDITVVDAINIANSLRPRTPSERAYNIRGVFRGTIDSDDSVNNSKLIFSIFNNGEEDVKSQPKFKAYNVMYVGMRSWASTDPMMEEGDTIVVTTQIQLYKGSAGEIPESCDGAYISQHIKPTSTEETTEETEE